jgi:hypothetical protein
VALGQVLGKAGDGKGEQCEESGELKIARK